MYSLGITAAAVSYVFFSMGLYEICRRRGISNPWLAWIPVVRGWSLGCISDQYELVNLGKTTHRRTWLVALPVLEAVMWVVSLFMGILNLIVNPEMGTMTTLAAMLMPMIVLWLVRFVVENMAVYDLHRSCNPENASLLLILGMVIPCFRALVVYINRGQELGMPPRRNQNG